MTFLAGLAVGVVLTVIAGGIALFVYVSSFMDSF